MQFSSLGKPLLFSHETENVTQKNGKFLENLTVFEKGIWQLEKHYITSSWIKKKERGNH